MMNDFLQWVKETYNAIDTALVAFFISFTMAMFRTKKHTGQADIAEACMCALFSIGIWSFLEFFGIPEITAVGIASMVGYFGTHWVSEKIRTNIEKFSNKGGKDDEKDL